MTWYHDPRYGDFEYTDEERAEEVEAYLAKLKCNTDKGCNCVVCVALARQIADAKIDSEG